MRHLSDGVKTSVNANAAAAGTTNVVGTIIDMQGVNNTPCDAIRYIASLGALTSTQVTKLLVEGSNNSDLSSATTIDPGTAALDADGNKVLITDIIRPAYRYIRCTVVRGTANAVLNVLLCEQYFARAEPVAQAASVSQLVKVVQG